MRGLCSAVASLFMCSWKEVINVLAVDLWQFLSAFQFIAVGKAWLPYPPMNSRSFSFPTVTRLWNRRGCMSVFGLVHSECKMSISLSRIVQIWKVHRVFSRECIVFLWPQLTEYVFITPSAHLVSGQHEPNWALAGWICWPPVPARLVSRGTGPWLLNGPFCSCQKHYAEDPCCCMVSSWKWEDWHARLHLSVYTTKKRALPSTISCSGFNQGLEISCTAHTGVNLLLSPLHLLLFPLPTQTAITARSDSHWKTKAVVWKKKKQPISSIV